MKAAELLRIGQMFDDLGWPTDVSENAQFPLLFEKFCRMWTRLTTAEQNLLLWITKSYVWIRPGENEERFLAAWNKAVLHLPQSTTTVAVAPLLKPGSAQPKSSSAIFYLAEAYRANLVTTLGARELVFCKSLSIYASRFKKTANVALVLVDDYVGSGDTARSALAKLRQLLPPDSAVSHVVILLALLAQAEAVASLGLESCLVVAERVCGRGISDNHALTNVAGALHVMDQLGKRLNIKKEERLGYGGTEALATLARTPNNTFPVYWTDRKVKGVLWDSPFTRYTDRARRRRMS